MTRFLKLVRHQNGNWQALPTDTEEVLSIPFFDKDDAPIDPAHLLKALDPLLFDEGGIKEISATQFASLMKKFSKKLVSRCVYINVLAVTKPDVLEKVLDQGGWCTINAWLTDAKESNHQSFLIKLLTLCKLLPMTVERLKENNTPKIVKSLSKFENEKIVSLSNELVTKWMTTIKGENAAVDNMKKKKKIKHPKENNKEQKDPKKSPRKEPPVKEKDEVKKEEKPLKEEKPVKEPPKPAARIKGSKRTSSEKGIPPEEFYEDVKIEIKPEPLPKKPKIDRPKTVKSFKGKFRATGLEEAAPLPKKISKKAPTVDKNVAAAVAKNAVVKRLNSTLPERITEKKIKPESLLNINDTTTPSGGIKLIPAKPRPPVHVLQESASFMDALVAQPAPPIKRKKKPTGKPTTPTTPPPTSPTIKPPKLQFYKDTLEMNNEEPPKDEEVNPKEEPTEDNEAKPVESSPKDESKEDTSESTGEERPGTPLNDMELAEDSINKEIKKEEEEEEAKEKETVPEETEEKEVIVPGQLRSILSHGRRKRKKSVRWVEDENLKQMFYFELDETERVNVLRNRPFGDLKYIEARREREAFEAAKRQAGDRMEEMIPWWIVPIHIDVPPPLTEPGCMSQEKEIQRIRQQSMLQAIYFTRDSIPDTPQEPESEIVAPQEPKIIPLDEENIVGSMVDYSSQRMPPPKATLPEVLTSLMSIPLSRSLPPQPSLVDQVPPTSAVMMPPQTMPQQTPASPTSPYDPGEPVGPQMVPNPIMPLQQQPPQPQPPLMPQPPLFNAPPRPMMEAEVPMPMNNNWSGMIPMNPPETFFPNMFPISPYPMIDPGMHPNMNPGGMRPIRNRMMGPIGKPPYPRPGGPRRGVPRVPCRHFLAGGCRFGSSCSFLHPGNNRPSL